MNSVFVGIGIALIIIGLGFGYFSGVTMEHSATSVNMTSVIANFLKDIAIAAALVVVGGLMVIFGIKTHPR
jgi:MFS superfamily sulfate permease-like transporter